MTWILALTLAVLILYFVPRRIVRLYRRDKLTASSFALTFSVGWVLAILIVFYLGLANILLDRRDPVLAALGLLIGGVNFALGYPIARLFYRRILNALLKRYPGK